MKLVESIECTSAEEIIEYLSPLNERWSQGNFIFRGQSNASYGLVPSVCRRGEGSFASRSAQRAFGDTSIAQIEFEVMVLQKFLEGCDRAGLQVSGYTENMKTMLRERMGAFYGNPLLWPDSKFYELLAVAQHNGTPTRLLDWTQRSFVAAYFAASSADFDDVDPDHRIAIWALDVKRLPPETGLQIVDTPGGNSRNQAAQSGVFTISHSDLAQPKHSPLGIEFLIQNMQTVPVIEPVLQKITLSINHAPRLLDLCEKFGVTGSSLFPGFQGVTRMVSDWAKSLNGITHEQSYIDESHEPYDD